MTMSSVSRPTLRKGAQGNDVRALQELLKTAVGSVPITVDGVFGDQTDLAVKVFQSRVFLEDDGIVGPRTWRALQSPNPTADLPTLRNGSTGKEVERVQRVLKFSPEAQSQLGSKGFYFGAIDGNFGPQTESAVKSFQKTPLPASQPLTADGIIGPTTWKALSSLQARIAHISL